MQDIPLQGGLKKINLDDKQFIANGKTYFIEDSMSFDRYIMYQILQHELAFEGGLEKVFENLKKGYELANQSKFADLAVLLHNVMQGIATVDQRRIPALDLCALFINTADEDRKVINNDMIKIKIEDWNKEGFDIQSFFVLAMHSIKGFRTIYSSIIQSTLED